MSTQHAITVQRNQIAIAVAIALFFSGLARIIHLAAGR
jgi:hypothetical protein